MLGMKYAGSALAMHLQISGPEISTAPRPNLPHLRSQLYFSLPIAFCNREL